MSINPIQNEFYVVIMNDEIKVCKGCLQDSIKGFLAYTWKEAGKLKDLGMVDIWESNYLWGDKKERTWTVKHIDNHPDCFNYGIKKIQKIYNLCVDQALPNA